MDIQYNQYKTPNMLLGIPTASPLKEPKKDTKRKDRRKSMKKRLKLNNKIALGFFGTHTPHPLR